MYIIKYHTIFRDIISVADPHHFDTDPDPTFHFEIDPDPTTGI
jgi:hypothetical protein